MFVCSVAENPQVFVTVLRLALSELPAIQEVRRGLVGVLLEQRGLQAGGLGLLGLHFCGAGRDKSTHELALKIKEGS